MPATGSGLLHWEDFVPGTVHEFGSVTVGREDILRFAREFDPQPFHLDEAAGAGMIFGGLVASGWHTASLAMRLMCEAYLLRSASLGSPGLDSVKWLKPVRPGDVLSLRVGILDARPMRSRPAIGLVRCRHEVLNQRGEPVLEMIGYGMFGRRTPGETTDSPRSG